MERERGKDEGKFCEFEKCRNQDMNMKTARRLVQVFLLALLLPITLSRSGAMGVKSSEHNGPRQACH